MKTLITVLVSIAASIASFYFVYNFVPQSILALPRHQTYGSTITTINGSDTISGSRSTINTNFANLNADKIEATQTTLNSLTTANALASIGTITSGTWHGSVIDGTYGGTGTSTPGAYLVLLGNGTYGVTVASSTGTSGQLLTSNGPGAYPSWASASFDTTQNYSLSGAWNLAGASTRIKNLIASSTITFSNSGAGVSYVIPTSQGASSTVMMNDGSGNLSWILVGRRTFATSTAIHVASTNNATSTIFTVPAGFINASSTIRIQGNYSCAKTGNTTATNCQFAIRNSAGQNYQAFSELLAGDGAPGTNSTGTGHFDTTIYLNNSLSSQTVFTRMSYYDVAGSAIVTDIAGYETTTSVNMANATSFCVTLLGTGEGNSTLTLSNLLIEVDN